MEFRATFLFLLLAWPPSSTAESLSSEGIAVERSEALAEAGAYAEAVDVLAPYAESQEPGTAYALAYAHMAHATIGRAEGEADPEGIRQAIHYAERATRGGNAGGHNLLYMIYANGYAVPRDLAKAADHLQRGAAAGDASAKLNYAVSLYEGSAAISRDREKACPLILELLQDEDTQAVIAHQAGLATIRGHCGLVPDGEAGVRLLRIAASRGITGAERDLGMALKAGIVGPKDGSAALLWFERAAARGDGTALWELGMAHVEGEYRERDSARAVAYFQRAAAEGSSDGMLSLAVMYATGDGVAQDYARARELYQQSADAGNAHAYRGLAVMHAKGEGGPPDLVRARTLYLQALELGDPEDPALRDALESVMNREQIERSDLDFSKWLEARTKGSKGNGGS